MQVQVTTNESRHFVFQNNVLVVRQLKAVGLP